MTDYSYSRAERLKSRKQIQRLFREGKSVRQYPLRLIWIRVEEPRGASPVQFAPAVPRRRFRRAVQRNRLRRQLREAYRLQKHELYPLVPAGEQLAIMGVYLGAEPLPYAEIERAMRKGLRRIGEALHASRNRY